ncbi:MAG: hypothetical protein AAF630_15080 [Cyanobacteria bacterium P01_C01_bin.38]
MGKISITTSVEGDGEMGRWGDGETRKEANRRISLAIPNYQLPTTDYQLPTTNAPCPIPNSL